MLPNSISNKSIQKHERRGYWVMSLNFKSYQINLQKKAKQDLEKNSIVVKVEDGRRNLAQILRQRDWRRRNQRCGECYSTSRWSSP